MGTTRTNRGLLGQESCCPMLTLFEHFQWCRTRQLLSELSELLKEKKRFCCELVLEFRIKSHQWVHHINTTEMCAHHSDLDSRTKPKGGKKQHINLWQMQLFLVSFQDFCVVFELYSSWDGNWQPRLKDICSSVLATSINQWLWYLNLWPLDNRVNTVLCSGAHHPLVYLTTLLRHILLIVFL